jgi:Uncharacterized protein conserved in bacteria (DUF2272)
MAMHFRSANSACSSGVTGLDGAAAILPFSIALPGPLADHRSRKALSLALLVLTLAGCEAPDAHVPPFARVPYQPFSRAAAIAVALDEWRLWGSRVDDDPLTWEPANPQAVPEREEGFWQRVGEYWWQGMNAGEDDARLTGKYIAPDRTFPVSDKGDYAWSAAFVSYVMRIAGAGREFPYAPAHAAYINAAARGKAPLLTAENPASYAPRPGDLVCFARSWAADLRFQDLPTKGFFPAHCGIVTAISAGQIDMVGGNVDNAVVLTHIAATPDGRLSDTTFQWLVVLRVNYAA